MRSEIGGALSLGALALATPLTIWLFVANPQSAGELGSRLALGLSPDRFGADMYAASERLAAGRRFFDMEDPSPEDAAAAQRELLRARGHFARAVERAGSPAEALRARNGWAEADLDLARWSLAHGKGRSVLRGDDEDLFRWGLAYAREGLALSGIEPATHAALVKAEKDLERELTFWR
ncbi:MAG: hypothetical protein H0V09_02375 [Gemmatimonadetes bacterium]|nr:hypothetical protein [Gemmatimonadota bacterium]